MNLHLTKKGNRDLVGKIDKGEKTNRQEPLLDLNQQTIVLRSKIGKKA